MDDKVHSVSVSKTSHLVAIGTKEANLWDTNQE